MPEPFRLEYNPALDGLRAIAILSVMAFHLELQGTEAGFLGVDMFFVLSGFLITSLLIAESQKYGKVRFGRFYVRRLLRLVPALYLLLAVTGFVVVLVPHSDLIATGIGMSNLAVAYHLVPSMNERPLVHTWSVATEWQYYLLWPPVLVLLLRREVSRRNIILGLIAVALACGIWRGFVWHATGSIERAHYALDVRVDGLLLGSALGLFLADAEQPRRLRGQRKLRLATYAALAIMLALLLSRWQFDFFMYGAQTIFIVAVAVVLLGVVVDPPPLLQRVLAFPPLVWIGMISYGLYLWHLPILQYLYGMLGYEPHTVDTILTMLGLAFSAALLSYFLVETPALRLKSRLGGAWPRKLVHDTPAQLPD
jgi:peptidoglycan/LPS O-acetylase OafA/YrhL